MLAKITLYDGTVYKIASATTDTQDGIYLGRIKDELQLVSQMQEAGNAPTTVNLTIINHDNFIPRTKDLWAAELLLTNDNDVSWRGKINFCNFDADGNLYVTASEKTAPELELQLPDEVRQVYTVDEDFHQSSVTMTIPLVIGGTTSNPITLPTILIDKTRGIYLICVGEIRSIVKVYNGAEQLPQTAYTAYTGTADQQENAGFAYVQIAEDYRLNSDGSYAEINVDVVGLKLGNHTEAECRNGARFLYYFLTTADTGINGWGCGIDSSLIDTTSFNSAITLCDQLGYKLDGIMWLRQSAQSWIDQICQAIHGKYSINANGKRSLFIDYAGNASKKTFTASNMQVERYGKNSYTSVVYNKGVLSYDYNPITGLFMQSAQYENSDSIAQIGEQKFIGESYLIKDATTALAVLEYTCKRSQIAAEAIEFDTDAVETNLRAGDIITINRPDLNLNNALYQIQSISTTDFQSSIIAVKFDTSIFNVTGTASTVNWGNERDITPALTPAMATSLNLSTGFDINPDGTGTPYISGTFTVPDGGWLAAAVQYGIGADPTNWTELALITDGRFKISPVNVGTVYSVRIRMITATGHSDYLRGQITATGDTTPPAAPTIAVKATDKTVTVQCGLDNPPYDMGGFQIYRKKSTEQVYTLIGSVAANRGYASFTDYVDEYVTYNYQAKSYDRSGNLSTNFSNVASVTVTGIQANDVAATALAMPTGSILRLSAKNCTTASIAEANGVKDVSGNGNHGQAGSGVSIINDEERGFCFSFDRSSNTASKLTFGQNLKTSTTTGLTISVRFFATEVNILQIFFDNYSSGSRVTLVVYENNDFGWTGCGIADHRTSEKIEANKWYEYTVVYGDEGAIKTYLNSELIDSVDMPDGADNPTLIGNSYVGNRFASNNLGLKGLISYFRIYPRALSASEIKTLYMFPDDVTFGQLTADLIGANIIKASNLVLTENIITTNAQIKQAVIDNMTITGNANFISEQQARAQVQTNLNTVTNNIYSPNTTTINGGKITTGTITADAIAANAITAYKLKVIGRPWGCILRINANGLQTGSRALGSMPDFSGCGNKIYKTTYPTVYDMKSTLAPICFDFRENTGYIEFPSGIITATGTYTVFLYVYLSGAIGSEYAQIILVGGASSNDRNAVYWNRTANRMYFQNYNGSAYNGKYISSPSVNAWHKITYTVSNGVIANIYVDGVWQTATSGNLYGVSINIMRISVNQNYTNNNNTYTRFNGMLADLSVFNRVLSEEEIIMLNKLGGDVETGELTADRIATDAIKSRNFSGSTDGSAFSSYGSFLDLANGNFVTPFFRLRSNSSNKDCQIGNYKINSNGFFSASVTSGVVKSDMLLAAQLIYLQSSTTDYSVGTKTASMAHYYLEINNQQTDNVFYVNTDNTGAAYSSAVVKITPQSTSKYGLYVAGKARINTTDYGSDEKTKKDFQDVSTLDKLKKLRVCAWRFDEEKLVEKDNAFIDSENIKIEAENKIIEAENIEIDKQNLLLMAKKSKSTEEEIKLIERKPLKKLREHRIADKTVRHPLNIGCMAGEFNKAFGTNDGSEDCLSVTDTIGVCMRAIQELADIVDSQKAEIAEFKALLKNQQDEKSDVEQESSCTEKSDNSKDADNLDFPDVGKIQKINKKDKSNEKTINTAVSASDSSNN